VEILPPPPLPVASVAPVVQPRVVDVPPKPVDTAAAGCLLFFFVLVAASVGLWSRWSEVHDYFSPPPPPPPSVPPLPPALSLIHKSARSLTEEYARNEIAASDKFERHPLMVTGDIERIGKENDGQAYLTLRGSTAQWRVKCYLDSGSLKDAAELHVGQSVVVTGKETRAVKSSGGSIADIVVRDSKLEFIYVVNVGFQPAVVTITRAHEPFDVFNGVLGVGSPKFQFGQSLLPAIRLLWDSDTLFVYSPSSPEIALQIGGQGYNMAPDNKVTRIDPPPDDP
jgi:hypothetical protein